MGTDESRPVVDRWRFWNGFLGFLGLNGFLAFRLHEPVMLFQFCFFAYFASFRYAQGRWSSLKYLSVLAVAGFAVALLGVTGLIPV